MSPVFVFIFHLGDFIPYGYCTFGPRVCGKGVRFYFSW